MWSKHQVAKIVIGRVTAPRVLVEGVVELVGIAVVAEVVGVLAGVGKVL